MKMILFIMIFITLIGCGTFTKVESGEYYKLKKIETNAYEDYVYFEFVFKNQTYKLLASKSEEVEFDISMCKLRKNHYYKIHPERIYGLALKNKSIDTLNLQKIRFYGKKRIFVGGSNHPVYQSKELIGIYIFCDNRR